MKELKKEDIKQEVFDLYDDKLTVVLKGASLCKSCPHTLSGDYRRSPFGLSDAGVFRSGSGNAG